MASRRKQEFKYGLNAGKGVPNKKRKYRHLTKKHKSLDIPTIDSAINK